MSMFCYQCQETAKNTGCTVRGVCGKTEEVAKLQDLIVYTLKGIADIAVKGNLKAEDLKEVNRQVLNALFMTITNANFDDTALEQKIFELISIRDELAKKTGLKELHDAARFYVKDRAEMLDKAAAVGVLATKDEDIRSLKQMITYGLKGMAAYCEHALNLGMEDFSISDFIYSALSAILDDNISADDLVSLTLKTGEYGVKAMA